jgi:hypothetical protein
MASFSKRIDASIRQLTDRYNSHWSPTWKCDENYGQIGNTTEFEDSGEWYGGIKNLSLRFINVTIPKNAVINSATVSLTDNSTGHTAVIHLKICGIAEDNTAEFTTSPIADARTRSHTSAAVDWDLNFTSSNGTERASSDIKTVIQELVNRAGWSSGNALGLYIYDDGTSNDYWDIKYYSSYPSNVAILTIDYTVSGTTDKTITGKVRIHAQKTDLSLAGKVRIKQSFIVALTKIGQNVLTAKDPNSFLFHSGYNTFKIIATGKKTVNLSASTNSQSFTEAHGLAFTPLVTAFAKVQGESQVFPPNGYGVTIAGSKGLVTNGVNFNYITTDGTNITFNFDNTNGSAKAVDIRYYVLEGIL